MNLSARRFLVAASLLLLASCGLGDVDDGGPEPARGAIAGTLLLPGNVGGPQVAAAPSLPSEEEVQVAPGELLVRFAAEPTVASLSVDGQALQVAGTVAGSDFRLVRAGALSPAETLELAARLEARPDIEVAFPNWILHTWAAPDDEFYALQWHYAAMNLEEAWATERGLGSDVVVAVADTGVIAHPDLSANLLPGYDFVDRDDDPSDPGGVAVYHGAHVAGTIGAVTNNNQGVAGVNWGARLLPVRVLGPDGSGRFSDILEGVAWAAGNPTDEPSLPDNPTPARIINLSLGGNIGQACPREIDDLFGLLASRGVIVIAAAGNDNADATSYFPASCRNVITVGATGPMGARASYSNYGASIDVMAPGGDLSRSLTVGERTVVAGVLSTVRDDASGDFVYGFYQGTSMAAPHIAGLVSLMLASEPGLGFGEIRARLQEASVPLSAAACERPSASDCGAGLVDAAAALQSRAAAPPPPPAETEPLPTFVIAFYCLRAGADPCGEVDPARSRFVGVPTTSNRAAYRIDDLGPGRYLAAAWQDLNQNGEVDEGEPFGTNPNLLVLAAGETQRDIVIVLEPFAVNAAPGLLEALRSVVSP